MDDAIVSLQHRISGAPKDGESYNLLCRAYFALADWDKGIAACEKAVALDPQNARYHMWLGRVYGEKADHSSFLSAAGWLKVRSEFETAVRLVLDSAEARTDLAEFYGLRIVGVDATRLKLSPGIVLIDPVRGGWVKWTSQRGQGFGFS